MVHKDILCSLDLIYNRLSFVESQLIQVQKAKTNMGKSIVTFQDLNKKQNLLIGGVNIKKINGVDLMGSGNIVIGGNGEVLSEEITETLIGVINNSNVTFTTTYDFNPNSELVFINGFKQKKLAHYNTIGNKTIIFTSSPETGDILEINYKKI